MDKKKKCIVCSEVGSAVTNHCAGGLSKTLYLALYCIASLRRLNELLGQRNLKKKLSGLGGGGGGNQPLSVTTAFHPGEGTMVAIMVFNCFMLRDKD